MLTMLNIIKKLNCLHALPAYPFKSLKLITPVKDYICSVSDAQ